MKRLPGTLAILLTMLVATGGSAQSPYVGLEGRSIKALSPEQIHAYEAGDGMGFALAAELNRYPGPKHVLELRDELGLTAEQAADTRAVFDEMKAQAVALGERIVAAERELDRLFATDEITANRLAEVVSEIARLRGQLRVAHLGAHLRMVQILGEGQVSRYESLRGYGGGHHGGHESGGHHQRHQ